MTYISRPPVSVVLGGLDLNGDGTTGDLLPGTKVNQFNRGLGNRLQRLVDVFNEKLMRSKKNGRWGLDKWWCSRCTTSLVIHC